MTRDRESNRVREVFSRPDAIDEALKRAVLDAIREHQRAGRPIVISRGGQVVELRGEEIDRELERALADRQDKTLVRAMESELRP